MAIYASDPGGGRSYDPVKEGMHHGICYGIYDLGHQFQEKFGKSAHKAIIVWELPDERIEIEKDGTSKNLPRSISNFYTVSLHEKSNLRKHLESWRGKAFTDDELKKFDILKLLGVNCTLQIIHRKKEDGPMAVISSIIPLMPHMEKKKPENPVVHFSFSEGMTNIPNGTPDWIADKIKTADEWGGDENAVNDDSDPGYPDDDIPF